MMTTFKKKVLYKLLESEVLLIEIFLT